MSATKDNKPSVDTKSEQKEQALSLHDMEFKERQEREAEQAKEFKTVDANDSKKLDLSDGQQHLADIAKEEGVSVEFSDKGWRLFNGAREDSGNYDIDDNVFRTCAQRVRFGDQKTAEREQANVRTGRDGNPMTDIDTAANGPQFSGQPEGSAKQTRKK